MAFLLSIMETELGKDEPYPEILAVLCIGFSKLLLLGVVDDPKVRNTCFLCVITLKVTPIDALVPSCCLCLSRYGRQSGGTAVSLIFFRPVQHGSPKKQSQTTVGQCAITTEATY